MSTTTNLTTLSPRAALALLANDLIYASAIGAAAVIAYRPTADTEETVRTISQIERVKMTANRDYIVSARDDAHPDRPASTFRLDRLTVCAYCDATTGAIITL